MHSHALIFVQECRTSQTPTWVLILVVGLRYVGHCRLHDIRTLKNRQHVCANPSGFLPANPFTDVVPDRMPLVSYVIDDKSPLISYDATWLPGNAYDDTFATEYVL